MPKNASYFYKKLILWYLQNKRSLPWRETKDPYKIWLSEIMLQQTRVAQGLPYYLKFVKEFPTIHDLANASEDKVLKLWQGLGYYSRARNLHFTAKVVSNEMSGHFPSSYKELLRLKGVGDYTASAIASICFNEPAAVVDGNVYRVLSRVFGVVTPINSTQGIKEFKALAQGLIKADEPGEYNQAIMEFGARYCVPQNPRCEVCIFSDKCLAFQKKKVSELPVKLKKTKIKKLYFNYIVCISKNKTTILEKRTHKGIWQNLHQFPLVESDREINEGELRQLSSFVDISETHNIEKLTIYKEESVVHKLSHRHLYTRFWIAEILEPGENEIPIHELKSYAVPVLIENFVSEFSPFNSYNG